MLLKVERPKILVLSRGPSSFPIEVNREKTEGSAKIYLKKNWAVFSGKCTVGISVLSGKEFELYLPSSVAYLKLQMVCWSNTDPSALSESQNGLSLTCSPSWDRGEVIVVSRFVCVVFRYRAILLEEDVESTRYVFVK